VPDLLETLTSYVPALIARPPASPRRSTSSARSWTRRWKSLKTRWLRRRGR